MKTNKLLQGALLKQQPRTTRPHRPRSACLVRVQRRAEQSRFPGVTRRPQPGRRLGCHSPCLGRTVMPHQGRIKQTSCKSWKETFLNKILSLITASFGGSTRFILLSHSAVRQTRRQNGVRPPDAFLEHDACRRRPALNTEDCSANLAALTGRTLVIAACTRGGRTTKGYIMLSSI